MAGTTDTGSIDPLDELADVAADAGAWFHVDAAYGGFFALTDRGRARLRGIERADSVTVDAHKGLFLPYGVGAILVRDPDDLVAAHEGTGAYFRGLPTTDGLPHYCQRGPELTRPTRGPLLWFPLQLHGTAAFAAELDRMLDLAAFAHARLAAMPGIVVGTGAGALHRGLPGSGRGQRHGRHRGRPARHRAVPGLHHDAGRPGHHPLRLPQPPDDAGAGRGGPGHRG